MIYVCYHKKYPIVQNALMKPIHVGKALSQIDLDMIGDDTGDNISAKNPYFCELTATYWIWKNTQDDIVGLCHYRRFFNLTGNDTKAHAITDDFALKYGLTKEKVNELLTDYDIILPKYKVSKKNPIALYENYKKAHVISDMDLVLEIIKEKYPKQYQVAYNTLHHSLSGYYANMLITHKPIFDDYAKWLFDILFEVEKRIQSDVLKRDVYQQRVYGFLSERMMTVYMALHPELKIKEMPMLFIEEDERKWRKYQFRRFRRNLFKKLKGILWWKK